MKYLFKKCRYIITQNAKREIMENYDLLVIDNRIAKIDKNIRVKDAEIIDCSNLILLPGFTNAHTHSPMSILRGYFDDYNLFTWLNKIWEIEDKLNAKHIRLGSELSIMEMLSHGIVTFIDMYFFCKETIKMCMKYNIKCLLGEPIIDKNADKRILKNRYLKKYENNLIKIILNPHAIYTCSKETLKKVKKEAEKSNMRIHIHAAETRKEVFECYKKNSMFVIEYLNSLGLLNKTILAHCGWITKNEINLIKKTNSFVVHNPISNMKLSTGAFFPYKELKNEDIVIGLGTDGPASNNSLNMFNDMKVMSLLNKNNYWSSNVITAQEVLDAATINGSIISGFNNGSIEEGKSADVIGINTNSISLQPLRKDNIISNIVYAFSDYVEFTMINGKFVFKKDFLKEWQLKANRISKQLENLFK